MGKGVRELAVSLLINAVSSVVARIAAIFVLAMGLLITVDVILRYVFNAPTQFADEVSAYLLVTITFLPLAYTLQTEKHIRVDVFTTRLSQKARNLLELVTSIMGLAFLAVVMRPACNMTLESYRYGSASVGGLHTPLYLPQLFIPIGLCLLILQLVLHIINTTIKIRSP